jgi:hypothetical protein
MRSRLQTDALASSRFSKPTRGERKFPRSPPNHSRMFRTNWRNSDSGLRRQYYMRLSPVLAGEQFEIAIGKTEGFSFAQLRETYILGAQSAFEQGREVTAEDVVDAIELQEAEHRN